MMTRHLPTRTTRRLGWSAPLLALGLAATSCSESPQEAADDTATTAADGSAQTAEAVAFSEQSPCLVSGGGQATGTPIKVGSLQAPTISSGQGAKAFFDCLNANGGINGRPVEFLVEDDLMSPVVSNEIATRLIEDEEVVAFVASTSLADCAVNDELYVESDVVSIYATAAIPECYQNANIASVSTGPRLSTIGVAQHLAEVQGAQSLACVAADAPSALWPCLAMVAWGDNHGVDVTAVVHPVAAPDFGAVIDQVVAIDPDGVVLVSSVGWTIELLAAAQARDLRQAMSWAAPTTAYVASLPADIGEYWWGHFTVHTQLAMVDAETTDNQAWLTTIDEYGAEDDPRDVHSQAGWLAARIFADTLLDLDPDTIDRDTVTEAIRAVDSYPTDLTCGSWYFGPGERHNPIHGGRIVALNVAGRFELIEGCEEAEDAELSDILALEEQLGIG